MSAREQHLKLELTKAITKWIADEAGEDSWPAIYIHEDIESQMADAAFAVFQACCQNQNYLKKENLMKP